MPISDYYRRLREKIGTQRIFSPSVVAVIPDAEGRVLFVQGTGEDSWGLPAGAIELGETPAEAVMREVFEETGLRVVPTQVLAVFGGSAFRYTYPDGNQVEYTITVFSCKIQGGLLEPVDGEVQAFHWFDPIALPPMQFPYPPDLFTRGEGQPALF